MKRAKEMTVYSRAFMLLAADIESTILNKSEEGKFAHLRTMHTVCPLRPTVQDSVQ
jgi:hypothetical protein